MALGRYAATIVPIDPLLIAVLALLVVTALLAFDPEIGGTFQVASTLIKVIVIVLFVLAGFVARSVSGSLPLAPVAGSPVVVTRERPLAILAGMTLLSLGWMLSRSGNNR